MKNDIGYQPALTCASLQNAGRQLTFRWYINGQQALPREVELTSIKATKKLAFLPTLKATKKLAFLPTLKATKKLAFLITI